MSDEQPRCVFCGALHVGMCSPTTLRRESARLRSERDAALEALREAVGALQEIRTRLHVVGRRPEECHNMSIADDAIATARAAMARLTPELFAARRERGEHE